MFDVDLLLELGAVAHFHEFMGVAGIAVAATEFAASVRIDAPGERHPASTDRAVQQGFRGESEVFDDVPLAQGFGLGGQPGDADQRRFLRKREQGRRRLVHRFAFCSPMIVEG